MAFLADFFFDDEDFEALAFDFDALAFFDFEALAFDLALCAERADERDDLARRLRAERERVYSGRFHPTARSARNDRGMSRMPRFESVTARAAASARSARTSLITFAGRRARAACTRFVSSTTNISRSGSIQSDVPVKPVWPYAVELRYVPQLPLPPQVSHPMARVPAARRVNSRTVESAMMRVPL